MLPQTVVHWQSSAGVGVKFGAEQFKNYYSELVNKHHFNASKKIKKKICYRTGDIPIKAQFQLKLEVILIFSWAPPHPILAQVFLPELRLNSVL